LESAQARSTLLALTTLVEFPLEGGGTVVVEADDRPGTPGGEEPTRGMRPAGVAERAGETFEAAFSRVRPTAEAIVNSMRGVGDSPDEIEVEFGVKVNAEAGAVVAKAAGEANFTIKLRWIRGRG
jgi:hypothetical protein